MLALQSTPSLALCGGSPAITKTFRKFNGIGPQEQAAAQRVIESGVLSGFLGAWTDEFYGGPEVKNLEKEWASHFDVKHAVSVNSATSGLYAAVGALGIGPGDEVIVTPLSMSASATAPLIYGAIPVFADVLENTACLNPQSVLQKITPRTKAIITVNLFGYSSELEELMSICTKFNIKLIEDNAQSPGAVYHGKPTGTWGHVGIFSLNRHKHIQTGEGGIITTNDDELASRLQLIRNHAEAVVEGKEEENLINMVGFNYRMTELEAALAREQLKKLPDIINKKEKMAQRFAQQLASRPGLKLPSLDKSRSHVYYLFPLWLDALKLEMNRSTFVKALKAEGVPIVERYVKPLYLSPLFQNKVAFKKYPFQQASPTYARGDCPVAEKLYDETLCYIPWCAYDFDETDVDLIVQAIDKVLTHAEELS